MNAADMLLSRWAWFYLPLATLLLAFGSPQQASAQETEKRKMPLVFTEGDPTSSREVLRVESARWQVTEEEYARYLELMKGPRGSFSVPNITPVEVLGIHAETPAERDKYASLWVALIKADTERVLVFQNAVNNVWKNEYANEPMINRRRVNQLREASDSKFGPLRVNQEQTSISLSGRTMFFTRPRCSACDNQLETALDLMDSGQITGLDIYLGGVVPGDDEAILRWARDRRLPIERLADRSITLNHDAGVSTTVANQIGRSPSIPMAVQRRGEAYEWVTLR